MHVEIKNKKYVVHNILDRRVMVFEDVVAILNELGYIVDQGKIISPKDRFKYSERVDTS